MDTCWCKKCTPGRRAVSQGLAFDSATSTWRKAGRSSLYSEDESVKASKARDADIQSDESVRVRDDEGVKPDDRGMSLVFEVSVNLHFFPTTHHYSNS
jgi:hypothetical protein